MWLPVWVIVGFLLLLVGALASSIDEEHHPDDDHNPYESYPDVPEQPVIDYRFRYARAVVPK